MAIIDRVKKRIQTDLDDTELQLIIDEANQDVINRFGPHADPAAPVTIRLEGYRKKLVVDRPIDVTQPVIITEWITYWEWGEVQVILDPLDYRIWPGSYIVERLPTGPNAWPYWQNTVTITYTPINDGDQREEVIIKLVLLDIQYNTLTRQVVGDYSEEKTDYQAERKTILDSLISRHGLGMA